MMNPPCTLDADGYCARHDTRHLGHLREFALGTDAKSQAHRAKWDAKAAQRGPTLLGMAAGVGKALLDTAGRLLNGQPVRVPLEVLDARQGQCRDCDQWTGLTCKLCGCRGLKLHLPDQECPKTPPRWLTWNPPPGAKEVPMSVPEREAVRHLRYIMYPRRGNLAWQRNVEQLLARAFLFNGTRVVAVIQDDKTDSLAAVRAKFGTFAPEFLTFPNDPALREVVAFRPLFDTLAHLTGPEHYTFFAHAKGVTHPDNPGVTVHHWTRMQYISCLDYWPLVADLLSRHALAGSFKKSTAHKPRSPSRWHYSGTFYWLKHDRVFTRSNWKRIEHHWWGTESWPGLVFPPEDGATLFYEGRDFNLYERGFFERFIEPEFDRWQTTRRPYLTPFAPGPCGSSSATDSAPTP